MTYILPDSFRKISREVTKPINNEPIKKPNIPQHRLMPEYSLLEHIIKLEGICNRFNITIPSSSDYPSLINFKDSLEMLIIKYENAEIRKYNNANANKSVKQ